MIICENKRLQLVLNRSTQLSNREVMRQQKLARASNIFLLIEDGFTYKQIAKKHGITSSRVG